MNDQDRIRPCEQAVDGMPHSPHFYKRHPDDKPDAWECPGLERNRNA